MRITYICVHIIIELFSIKQQLHLWCNSSNTCCVKPKTLKLILVFGKLILVFGKLILVFGKLILVFGKLILVFGKLILVVGASPLSTQN